MGVSKSRRYATSRRARRCPFPISACPGCSARPNGGNCCGSRSRVSAVRFFPFGAFTPFVDQCERRPVGATVMLRAGPPSAPGLRQLLLIGGAHSAAPGPLQHLLALPRVRESTSRRDESRPNSLRPFRTWTSTRRRYMTPSTQLTLDPRICPRRSHARRTTHDFMRLHRSETPILEARLPHKRSGTCSRTQKISIGEVPRNLGRGNVIVYRATELVVNTLGTFLWRRIPLRPKIYRRWRLFRRSTKRWVESTIRRVAQQECAAAGCSKGGGVLRDRERAS